MRPSAILAAFVVLGGTGCLEFGPDTEPQPLWPAHRYLLPNHVPYLVLNVHHAEGLEPLQSTLQAMSEQLRVATGRTAVRVHDSGLLQASPGPDGAWSSEEFSHLFAEIDVGRPQSDTAAMAIAFVDGSFEDGVAGLAFIDRAVVFAGGLAFFDVAPGVRVPNPERAAWERAAAVHELGHLLGLVDLWVPRNHGEIAEDGQHSADPGSVMYYAIHGISAAGLLPDQVPHRYNDDDLADLRDFQRGWGFEP